MSDANENLLVKQQKSRAQRIDHDYHRKPNAWRTWMRSLVYILPILGIGAIAALTFLPGHLDVYEPGPVSNRHIWFDHRCEDCHEAKNENGKFTFGVVSNRKCRACHDGPLHNNLQLCPEGAGVSITKTELVKELRKPEFETVEKTYQEPRCASCHTEHKGNQQLVVMSDNHCTQCHEDLKKSEGALIYTNGIKGFAEGKGHPEWKALRDKAKDLTPLRFNHSVHMEKVSYDSDSQFGARKMECADCHKTSQINLEQMRPESERADNFEKDLKPSDIDAFYTEAIAGAANNGVVKYVMTQTDIRRMLVETLSQRSVWESLHMDPADKVKLSSNEKKTIALTATMALVREKFGHSNGSGQDRYMVPITYERNCATACHKHELKKVAGVIPPHDTAQVVRSTLRNAIYSGEVQKLLGGGAMKPEDKAKMGLIDKYRKALEKKMKTPMPAKKDEKNKALVDVMHADDEAMLKDVKDALGDDDMMKVLDGGDKVNEKSIKGYDKLSEKKKKDFNEELSNKLEELINSYVDDAPVTAANIDSSTDDKLNEGLKLLFAPATEVRNKNDRGACLFCHDPSKVKPAKPEDDAVIQDSFIPVRWLNHALFNHETHRVVDCESCHSGARASKETSDVLLPGINNCQKCHNPKGAREDCIECHQYHDKSHQNEDHKVEVEGFLKDGAKAVIDMKKALEGSNKPPDASKAPEKK